MYSHMHHCGENWKTTNIAIITSIQSLKQVQLNNLLLKDGYMCGTNPKKYKISRKVTVAFISVGKDEIG
jgi:hypothetical protein